MRLSPLDPELARMQAGMAVAHLFLERFDTAASWAEKALQELPDFLLAAGILATSHAHAGRMPEAQRALVQVRKLNPVLTLSGVGDWLPIQRADNLAILVDGLRKAGLPA